MKKLIFLLLSLFCWQALANANNPLISYIGQYEVTKMICYNAEGQELQVKSSDDIVAFEIYGYDIFAPAMAFRKFFSHWSEVMLLNTTNKSYFQEDKQVSQTTYYDKDVEGYYNWVFFKLNNKFIFKYSREPYSCEYSGNIISAL